MKKIIENDLIYLREFAISDGVCFFKLNKDPKVVAFTGDTPFLDLNSAISFLYKYPNYKRDGYGRWAVCLQENNKFIGWCGLNKSQASGSIDIGFRFYRAYWGKGFATMAAQMCIDYGFKTVGLSQIVANVYVENTASIRVLKKCGMTLNKMGMYDGREAVFYTINNIQVKEIEAVDTLALRTSILRQDIPLSTSFEGDDSNSTIHVGAFLEGEIVGICSFMKSRSSFIEGTQYQLRGMAISKKSQGKGIGSMMLAMGLERIKEKGISFLWCKARKEALGFYKKQGFEIVGSPFEIEYIGWHYTMFKKII